MKAHPALAEQASFTLYRKRTASALAACGGYDIAALFFWAARQSSAQVAPGVLGAVFGTAFGAALLLMSTAALTMAALNTPIAIFTPDGILVGGVGFLLDYKRLVPWNKITALDTVRVRNRTLLQIQLRQASTSRERKRAPSLLWALARSLNSDMNFSERPMATPVSEVIAELQQRFANELHENRIRIKG